VETYTDSVAAGARKYLNDYRCLKARAAALLSCCFIADGAHSAGSKRGHCGLQPNPCRRIPTSAQALCEALVRAYARAQNKSKMLACPERAKAHAVQSARPPDEEIPYTGIFSSHISYKKA